MTNAVNKLQYEAFSVLKSDSGRLYTYRVLDKRRIVYLLGEISGYDHYLLTKRESSTGRRIPGESRSRDRITEMSEKNGDWP